LIPDGKTRRACRLGILFGAAAIDLPLVNEAFGWEHGVFLESACGSKHRRRVAHRGVLRRDLLPCSFCAYHLGDYLSTG
jgi:GTP-dependent phosphoenolpyruvate carboxykinase